MMISAEMFRAAHENDSIFDLLTERDQLVEEILTFESEAEILTGAPDNSGTSFDDGWDDSPTSMRESRAPEPDLPDLAEIYSSDLEYLQQVFDLLQQNFPHRYREERQRTFEMMTRRRLGGAD